MNKIYLPRMQDMNSKIDWMDIEKCYFKPLNYVELIWLKKKERPKNSCINPFAKALLWIWDTKKQFLAPTISPASSFLGQPWFKPAEAHTTFQVWRSAAFKFSDITNKGVLLTKIQLEKKLQKLVPWFEYLQVQNLLCRPDIKQGLLRPCTDFEKNLRHTEKLKGLT